MYEQRYCTTKLYQVAEPPNKRRVEATPFGVAAMAAEASLARAARSLGVTFRGCLLPADCFRRDPSASPVIEAQAYRSSAWLHTVHTFTCALGFWLDVGAQDGPPCVSSPLPVMPSSRGLNVPRASLSQDFASRRSCRPYGLFHA